MEGSYPPDYVDRLARLEQRVQNMERAQRGQGELFGLADVEGGPGLAGQTIEYDRATGTWRPAMVFEPGDVKWSASNESPTGRWLLADGSNKSRTTYADLFRYLGTRYGAGDGSTTFGLPDLRNVVVVGAGATYALGATGGEATHVLSVAELPSHQHGMGIKRSGDEASGYGLDPTSGFTNRVMVDSGAYLTAGVGSGAAHNNLQPYIVLWGYIRY